MHDYTIIEKGVLYESIYENHYESCIRRSCFCHSLLRESGFSWEELHGHKYRDRFLTSYLTQLFSEYISEKTRSLKSSEEFHKLRFSFLSFLIEVVNVPTSSYVQVVSMINQLMKQSNLKEQMIFKSMEYKANQTFYNFFNNPSVYNQRLHLNRVMEFDDIYKELQMKIKTCILLLRDMYVMMQEDFIDLDELLKLGTQIIKFKKQIHIDLQTLFSYNPSSQRAFEMCQIYSETLDLMKKKPKQYKTEALLKARKIFIQRNYQDPEKEINLFSQEACVIYVSLLDPIGTIKRISQSTYRVFGFQAKECIGKNCNIFIPNEINKIHNEILNRFVEGGQLKGINAGELKMFGVKKSGYAFPIKFRLRLDPTFANDFGVSGFFQIANSGQEYILFDLSGKITNISEKFYKTYFCDNYGEKNIWRMRELDILKMLPLLGGYLQQIKDQNVEIQKFEFNSIFIYPLVKDKYKIFEYNPNLIFESLSQFKNFSKSIKSRKCGFLSVTFKLGRMENSYTPLKVGYVQIEKYKRILDKHFCSEEIEILAQNLEERKKYLDIASNIIAEKSLKQQKSIMTNNEQSKKSLSLCQPSPISRQDLDKTSSPKRKSLMSQHTIKTSLKNSRKSMKFPHQHQQEHLQNQLIYSQENNDLDFQSNINDLSKYKNSKNTTYNNLESHNNLTDNDVILINLNKNTISTNIQTQSNSYSVNDKSRMQMIQSSQNQVDNSRYDIIQTQNNLNTTTNHLIQFTNQNNDTAFQLETTNQLDQSSEFNKNNMTAIFSRPDQREFDIFDSYNFDEQRKKLGGIGGFNYHAQYLLEDSVISPKTKPNNNQQNESLQQQQQQQQQIIYQSLSSSDEKNNASKYTKDKDSSEQADLKHFDGDFANRIIQVNPQTIYDSSPKSKNNNELNQYKTNETFGAKQNIEQKEAPKLLLQKGVDINQQEQGVINILNSDESSSFLTDSDDSEFSSNSQNSHRSDGYHSQNANTQRVSLNASQSNNVKTQMDCMKSYVDIPNGKKNKKNRRQTLEEIIAEVSNDSNMAGSQQKQFNDEIEGKRDIQNFVNKQDASSVHSGKTEFHSFKTMLQSGIQSKKTTKYMKSILVIGYLAIIVLISVTTVFFIQIRNYFEEEVNSYQMIVQGHNTKNVFSNIIADKEFLEMHNIGLISTNLSDERYQYYETHMMNSVKYFMDKIIIFQEEDQSVDYAQYLSKTFQNTTFYNERNSSMTMVFSKIYSLIITTQNLYFYAKFGRDINERYIFKNQENAYNIFDGIIEKTNEQSNRIVVNIEDILVLSIVSLEIICLFTVITSLPMFYSVQRQREEILKLFCTFQTNKLQERIDQCFAYSHHQMLESIGVYSNTVNPHEIAHNKKPNHAKKRTISNSKDLKKYNISLFGVSILVFILLSISPFTNYYTSKEFVNEFNMNIFELGLLPQNYALNYLAIKAIIEDREEWKQPLKNQIDKLSLINEQTTADLVQLTKNLEETSRYDYTLYQNIVKQMLNQEVCNTFETYKSYSYNSTLFNKTDCQTVYSQIWSNGYIIGIKAIFEIFKDLRALLEVKDKQKFIERLQLFDKSFNANAFQDLYYYCQSIPELIGSFMINSSVNYYDQRQTFLLQIFIFAFVLNSCILLYAWQAFYKYLAHLTFETKSILGVFSYDFVIDNPFIISYVKKEFSIT